MNSENSKISKLHVLMFNTVDNLDSRKVKKVLLYQNLVFITHRKT